MSHRKSNEAVTTHRLELVWTLGVLLGAAVLVPGCGAPAKQMVDSPGIADLTNPQQPLPVERFVQPEKAIIAPGDELQLSVLDMNELSGVMRVADDGRINMNLIGSIPAAGKSIEELDRDLTAALSAYYRNIDVSVNVSKPAPRSVYVLGQVKTAGRYDFRPGDRVVHSLALAGGLLDGAREGGVVLLRREEDGDHMYQLDFSSMHVKVAPQDIYLQPGDVVFVPKSRFTTVTDAATALLDVLSKGALTALYVDQLRLRAGNFVVAR